jgi:N-formylglutamate deformylase
MADIPDWTVFHVPHDSYDIPDAVRDQFILDDEQLAHELLRMTDHCTWRIFSNSVDPARIIRAPVSRLVVDVERFMLDANEPMSARGMGALYTRTCDGQLLRRELSASERKTLLENYYIPHHNRFECLVQDKLNKFGRCTIIDCHSFPSVALPYEYRCNTVRPDICIGTDHFHTPPALAQTFVQDFSNSGFSVALNDPFAGAIVPMKWYLKDSRVHSLMIELNRNLYMDELTGELRPSIDDLTAIVHETIRRCLCPETEQCH